MSGERQRLREFAPLTHLLSTIPHQAQKGFFSNGIDWTCLHATKEFIAVGTNIGYVYLYERDNGKLHKLNIKVKSCSVTCVRLQRSVDYVVAVGTSVGVVCIFLLPSIMPGKNKQLQLFQVAGLHPSAVRCVEWSQNALKVFSGDEDGVVLCTEMDYAQGKSQSYVVCKEPHTVVQLHYAYKTLLVSTVFRSLLCLTDDNNRVVQVGGRDRKIHGSYGAIFLPGVYQAKDAVLFASRPGLRLWKASIEGHVHNTYIFRDLVKDDLVPFDLLADTTLGLVPPKPADKQFGTLSTFQDTNLVTHHGCSLYVLDPGLGTLVGHHGNLGTITDVAACGEEIFVLRKVAGRVLIRLSSEPEPSSIEAIPQPLSPPSQMNVEVAAPASQGNELPEGGGQSRVDTSPVHLLSQTASKMSRGFVGALKEVGEKIQSIQDGRTATVAAVSRSPPWGSQAPSRNTPPGELDLDDTEEPSDGVDSAKEASPSNVPSPPDVASPSAPSPATSSFPPASAAEVHVQKRVDEDPPGAPAIVREDESCCEVSTLTAAQASADALQASAKGSPWGTPRGGSPLPPRLESVGKQDYEDIVFQSSTKPRRVRKKRLKPGKEKDADATSIASTDSQELMAPESQQEPNLQQPSLSAGNHQQPSLPAGNHQQPSLLSGPDQEPIVPSEPAQGPWPSAGHHPESLPQPGPPHQLTGLVPGIRSIKLEERQLMPVGPKPKKEEGATLHDEAIDKSPVLERVGERESSGAPSQSEEAAIRLGTGECQSIPCGENSEHPAPPVSTPVAAATAAAVTVAGSKIYQASSTLDNRKIHSGSSSQENLPLNHLQMGLTGSDDTPGPIKSSLPAVPTPHDEPRLNRDLGISMDIVQDDAPLAASLLSRRSDDSPDDFYSMYRSESGYSLTVDAQAPSIQEMVGDGGTGSLTRDSTSHGQTDGTGLLVNLDNTWTEFSGPGQLQSLSLSARHVWCTDQSDYVYVAGLHAPGLRWRSLPELARQIAVAPSGAIIWRLLKNSAYVATKVSSHHPEGKSWLEVARDVSYIAVDDHTAWYIKTSGELLMQKGLTRERPSYRSIPVACPESLVQVSCLNGVVWALTPDRNILVRTGIQPSRPEGTDWKYLPQEGPSQLVSSMALGDHETAWVLDLVGRVWFTTGVTAANPEGSGHWWQVSLGSYVMQDAPSLEGLRSLVSFQQALGKLAASNKGGLITASQNGVWVCPDHGAVVHVCRGSLLGHRWEVFIPSGMLPSTRWLHVSVSAMGPGAGSILWAQQPNSSIFCFPSGGKGGRITEVAPPVQGTAFVCLSASKEVVWAVMPDGRVFVREGMGSHCTVGLKWLPLNLTQLGRCKLVHISCGLESIWAVDSQGQMYLRLGLKPPSTQHLSPAWVPVEGATCGVGAYFTKVFTGPNDQMVWAVDNKFSVYVRGGITEELPIGTHWAYVSGTSAVWLCLSDDLVYALSHGTDQIMVRYGISSDNYIGDFWKQMPGTFTSLSVSAHEDLWAIDQDGQLHQRFCHRLQRRQALGKLSSTQQGTGVEEGWEIV